MPWLWGYAPLALIYRIVICTTIVVWLGRLSFLLGVAMALYFVWAMAAKPLVALWGFLQGPALAEPERVQARRRALFAGAALVALVGLLPLPFSSVVQGVVWLPEHAQVRAETEGFVDQVRVADGEAVRAGQTLFTLRFPMLEPERARLEGRITALETERYQPCAPTLHVRSASNTNSMGPAPSWHASRSAWRRSRFAPALTASP